MAHIHTNHGEHDITASAFIVRTDTTEPSLLFHMHKKLGVLLQPGGHIELHETPWDAIRHEIIEETGYDLSQLRLLQPQLRIKKFGRSVLHPQPVVINTHNFDPEGKHKHTDITYAFIADSEPMNVPSEGESTDIRWLNTTELSELDESLIFEDVRTIGQFILQELLGVWEPVQLKAFK